MGRFPVSFSVFTYYLQPTQVLLWGMILSMFGPSPGMNCVRYVEIFGKFPSAIFEVQKCETEPPGPFTQIYTFFSLRNFTLSPLPSPQSLSVWHIKKIIIKH